MPESSRLPPRRHYEFQQLFAGRSSPTAISARRSRANSCFRPTSSCRCSTSSRTPADARIARDRREGRQGGRLPRRSGGGLGCCWLGDGTDGQQAAHEADGFDWLWRFVRRHVCGSTRPQDGTSRRRRAGRPLGRSARTSTAASPAYCPVPRRLPAPPARLWPDHGRARGASYRASLAASRGNAGGAADAPRSRLVTATRASEPADHALADRLVALLQAYPIPRYPRYPGNSISASSGRSRRPEFPR